MNHIVIIGFMGSGKTRVGKRLAKDFNLPFVDVDRVVSKKMNLTMKEIFDRFGEPFYRALETTGGWIKVLVDSVLMRLSISRKHFRCMTMSRIVKTVFAVSGRC